MKKIKEVISSPLFLSGTAAVVGLLLLMEKHPMYAGIAFGFGIGSKVYPPLDLVFCIDEEEAYLLSPPPPKLLLPPPTPLIRLHRNPTKPATPHPTPNNNDFFIPSHSS